MRLYVPICPNVANSLVHTSKHWEWLLVVRSCVPMCQCAPMWPMVWDTAIPTDTFYPLFTHVSECAHLPVVANGLILTYNLWDWFFIVRSCVNLANDLRQSYNLKYLSIEYSYSYVPMCPDVAKNVNKLWEWLFIGSSCVPMCSCVPMWPMV